MRTKASDRRPSCFVLLKNGRPAVARHCSEMELVKLEPSRETEKTESARLPGLLRKSTAAHLPSKDTDVLLHEARAVTC